MEIEAPPRPLVPAGNVPEPGRRKPQAALRRTAQEIGLQPCPVRVHLRFLLVGRRYLALAFAPGGEIEAVASWLESIGGTETRTPTKGTSRVVTGNLDALPAKMQPLARGLSSLWMILDANGDCDMRFEPRAGAALGALSTAPADPPPVLTDRQERALAVAVEEGYYEVPRTVSLRELAQQLRVSPASLSELLRRAESRIIRAFYLAQHAPRLMFPEERSNRNGPPESRRPGARPTHLPTLKSAP